MTQQIIAAENTRFYLFRKGMEPFYTALLHKVASDTDIIIHGSAVATVDNQRTMHLKSMPKTNLSSAQEIGL
ncbi:hypothetical protein TRIUR3_02248 [Triticum urartu]|uniref:Uncharacterized protein n=1 Tax=Triticum urartu TaxID=4572 RepID=M7ZRT4_TRIUA|nr:hypothetical protein TRIUR3_02248 [Triticum urartu]